MHSVNLDLSQLFFTPAPRLHVELCENDNVSVSVSLTTKVMTVHCNDCSLHWLIDH